MGGTFIGRADGPSVSTEYGNVERVLGEKSLEMAAH